MYDKYEGHGDWCWVDANDQLFPLAFAIVEGENNNYCTWVMECLRMKVTERPNYFILSG